MSNWKTISQIAVVFGIIFIIFAIISAFLNYQAIILTTYSAYVTANYLQISILSAMLPFMLFAILSFVVAALGSRAAKETSEQQPQLAPVEPTA